MSHQIEVISASAGSGKTYALMEKMFEEISNGNVTPDGVMAVTYLKKAAQELSSRVRQRLIKGGKIQLAQSMEAARIGTVHSICTRILSDFSYELGQSPAQRAIDKEAAELLFRQVLGECLTEAQAREMERIGKILELPPAAIRKFTYDLCEKARHNNLGGAAVLAAIPDSAGQIGRVFPAGTGSDLDQRMKTALGNIAALKDPPDETKGTIKAMRAAKDYYQALCDDRLTWKDWWGMRDFKASVKAPAAAVFGPVEQLAAEFLTHPRLSKDIEAGIQLVHGIAAGALSAYEGKKKALGLVDFKDMEQQMLRLLDSPAAQERLKNELQLLLVDEFQDTNPVQLAIFIKLSKLCPKTVWVGDAKQSILGFTGADSTLMRAVVAEIAKGKPKFLSESWRSRKELVEFTSDLFVSALEQDGFTEQETRLTAATKLESQHPPLAVWKLEGKNLEHRWDAMAQEIKRLLDSKATVVDRVTEEPRPIMPGDIAILAHSNLWCDAIATAIRGAGLEASIATGTLSDQPEVMLALAALRFAVNSGDRLAAAEIAMIMGEDHTKWLGTALADARAQHPSPEHWCPALEKLATLKGRCKEFTPLELLDEAIAMAGIELFVERLEEGESRKLNLAALRGLAVSYEKRCTQNLEPCTVVGFLTYMGNLSDDEDAIPSWSRPDAVEILTQHSSKGLEWPIVIVPGLDKEFDDRASLFGTRVVARDKAAFDVHDPLKDRSVRFLPNPFGRASKGLEAIPQKMALDPEQQELVRMAEAEKRRVLYVAMTRPREMLIFTIEKGSTFSPESVAGVLKDKKGNPVFQIHPTKNALLVGAKELPCEMKEIKAEEASEKRKGQKARVLPRVSSARKDFALMHLSPSGLALAESDVSLVSLGEKIELGGKLLLSGPAEEDVIGNAVHAFFGADHESLKPEQRSSLAKAITAQWGLAAVLPEKELIEASDRLKKAVSSRWPGGVVTREQPMALKVKVADGETTLHGILDMAVTAGDEVAVIDHKSTNIAAAGFLVLARKYAPQLVAYSRATQEAAKKAKASRWLHLPLAGALVEVKVQSDFELLQRSVELLEGQTSFDGAEE